MNAEQLHKTLRASQYAEQVLGNHAILLEQDYAIDQFLVPLSTTQIQNFIHAALDNITDKPHGCVPFVLRTFDVSLDLARCQSTHRCCYLDP